MLCYVMLLKYDDDAVILSLSRVYSFDQAQNQGDNGFERCEILKFSQSNRFRTDYLIQNKAVMMK